MGVMAGSIAELERTLVQQRKADERLRAVRDKQRAKEHEDLCGFLLELKDDCKKAAEERQSILVQTTKTNGRVMRLEADAKSAKSRLASLEADQKVALQLRGRYAVWCVIAVLALGVFLRWAMFR